VDIFLIFQQPLHWLIVTLTNATGSYGLAIILFTLIIRGVLAPLYVAQIRASKKMVELSPRIKELQKKYAKDREALTRETMALYREHNHNPALGCVLPLIQLPILWSLFLVLRNLAHPASYLLSHHIVSINANLYTANFVWLQLGKPDPYHILPIVAGITQWIQQRMMLQPSNDPQQRQMAQIMQFLPLMIVVFAWTYPSGLAVYWVTSNILMMVMQYLISGTGSLRTSPFSIPYADGTVVAPAASSVGAGGFFARALAPRPAEPQREPAPRQNARPTVADTSSRGAPQVAEEQDTEPDDGGDRRSKMDRYAARHGRGASRGRPSAKGAKK
jgi:YidC/Oxa1 family membrane protein insertase